MVGSRTKRKIMVGVEQRTLNAVVGNFDFIP